MAVNKTKKKPTKSRLFCFLLKLLSEQQRQQLKQQLEQQLQLQQQQRQLQLL